MEKIYDLSNDYLFSEVFKSDDDLIFEGFSIFTPVNVMFRFNKNIDKIFNTMCRISLSFNLLDNQKNVKVFYELKTDNKKDIVLNAEKVFTKYETVEELYNVCVDKSKYCVSNLVTLNYLE